MTDKELLEMAAKAAGIEVGQASHIPSGGIWLSELDGDKPWSPLTNDGDALRLAVMLQISISNEHVSAGCSYCTKGFVSFCAIYSGSDEGHVIDSDFAATRRAIVIAAAEIGKSMP